MKQNMCVTIDQEIHSWLRSKNEMMSRVVNRILHKRMIEDMQEEHERKNRIESMRPKKMYEGYCPICDTTQTGPHNHCNNRACPDRGYQMLEECKVIE